MEAAEEFPSTFREPSPPPQPAEPPLSQPGADEVEPVGVPVQQPGMALSRDAIDKRLRRVFQPRADGTFLVSEDFLNKYRAKGSDREKLLVLFEKCDYNPDHSC